MLNEELPLTNHYHGKPVSDLNAKKEAIIAIDDLSLM